MGKYDRTKFATYTFPRGVMKDIDKLKMLKNKGKESRAGVIRRLIIEHNEHVAATVSLGPCPSRPTVRLPGGSTLQPPVDFIKAYRIWKSSGTPEPLFYHQCLGMGYTAEVVKAWLEMMG